MRRKTHRSLSEGGDGSHSLTGEEEDTLKNAFHPSEKMLSGLDEASNMMAKLTESLNTEFSKREEEVGVDVVKRRSRMTSGNVMNRLGIISTTMSTSEPGKTGVRGGRGWGEKERCWRNKKIMKV